MQKNKLNLGCGFDKRIDDDWIHIDKSSECNPDYIWDITKIPWPKEWAKANSIDYIKMDNLAEHIEPETWIEVIKECYRILKPKGIIWIRVPWCHPNNYLAAFSDPMHCNYFTEQTFGYYDWRTPRWKNFGRCYGIPKFEIISHKAEGIFITCELKKVL
ncbi:MAG: methyltransferase domain-containing protein [bacterium]